MWFSAVQRSAVRAVHCGSALFNFVPLCSGLFGPVQLCSGLFSSVRACSAPFGPVQLCSGLFREFAGQARLARGVPQ